MKLFILTILLAIAQADVIEDKCVGEIIRNICYEREILKEGLLNPYRLALDSDNQILYFSVVNASSTNEPFKVYETAYINVKTKEFGFIPSLRGGLIGVANAIDAKNHVVYFGGAYGIYTFDFDSKNVTHIFSNAAIYCMFYKDRIYYTDALLDRAYYYESGVAKKIEELKDTKALLIASDNDDNIFFSDRTGLFMYRRDNATILKVQPGIVNSLTTDITGNIYFSTPRAIYSINEQQVVKLIDLGEINGIAVDGDNPNSIYYADSDKIFKLTLSKRKLPSGGIKELANNYV